MTIQEAIYLLRNTAWLAPSLEPIDEAIEMACEALDKVEYINSQLNRADRKTESNSEKPNNCEYAKNPSGDVWECGCFLDTYCEHQIYDRNPDGTINIVECGYEPKTEPTISKMEQVDKDINVRSKDEPQTSGVVWTEDAIKNEPKSYTTWVSADKPQRYKPTCNGECRYCIYRAKDGNYCMKTDCSWK